MKNSKPKVLQPDVEVRAASDVVARVRPAKRAQPSAEVLEMFASIHRSDEFTVANALADYAGVKVKY
ncbi:hypothetical protein HSX11_00700 [Oxalobacteraceae bacterium]|nr:hypothetical protein [Oxalobacteraceae bacterium]